MGASHASPLPMRAIAVLAIYLFANSCSPDLEAAAPSVLPYVTNAVAANLGPGGTFVLPDPPFSADPQISRQQAEALAQIWGTQVLPQLREDLEQHHGGPIVFEQLKVCRRTFFSETSFAVQDTISVAAVKRFVGSWWLVGLCQQGEISISVAVSATATDLSIVDGMIVSSDPGEGGNDFFPIGVPSSWEGGLEVGPESAVINAGKLACGRVSAVPKLVSPPPSKGPPQAGLWKIELDQECPYHGVTSGQSGTDSVFYFGPIVPAGQTARSWQLAIPLLLQPPTETVLPSWTIPSRPGFPSAFEPAAFGTAH